MRKYITGGSNIIGVGGYGCLFDLGTLGDKTGKEFVGKINFNNEPMYTEYGIETLEEFMNIQNNIYNNDPNEKYFITTRKVLKMKREDELIKHCISIENEKFKNRRQEKAPFYDVFVQRKVNKSPPIDTWNEIQVQHAINGLKFLHSFGYVHNDVSENNFGFLNNLPVYIDMDGATVLKNVRVRNVRGRFIVDLNETPEFDFQQLSKAFR
jgi:hypothetical protein